MSWRRSIRQGESMVHRLWPFVAAILMSPALSFSATLPPAQQITLSTDGISERWQARTSTTSGGQILFVGSDDVVYLYDGTTIRTIQASVLNTAVEPAVFGLGSGAISGQVVAGWRRGAGNANFIVNGGSPVTIAMNPESVAIADGCAFMVLQTATTGQHAFKIDPSTGNTLQLSSGTVQVGAGRVLTSGCSKAIWTWQPTNTSPVDVQYWNGSTTVTLDAGVSTPSFAGGKVVYSKVVGAIAQVFVIDTNGFSLTPVQISAETDSSKIIVRPQTDGRHVVWYRSNADGSGAQLVLYGGLVFPTGPLSRVHNIELPFQLNRGQLLWKSDAGLFFYDDGRQTFGVDPASATTIEFPWLTDGFIAFMGRTLTGGTDTDVFRVTATSPSDANQPSAPLTVVATPGTTEVKFDSILGATSYNAYVALVPGVTKDNFASLAGGQKITGVTSPFSVSVLPGSSYFVAVTAVEGSTEGPSSRVGGTTVVGNLTWQPVGGLSATQFFSVASDLTNASFVYAGANGAVHKSSDGGISWTEVLTNAMTQGTRVSALAISGANVFASSMTQGDIWRSPNRGSSWDRTLNAGGMSLFGSLAIDPVTPSIMYGGDFLLPGRTFAESTVIKSVTGGSTWTHSPQPPGLADELNATALAIDPSTPSIIYAGGNGTPNLARSNTSGASWISTPIIGGGGVQSLSIDPRNTQKVFAATRDKGVFRTLDSGTSWTARNNGLAGVSGSFSGGAGFHSILVDTVDSNYIHLGAGNGYWYSVDGGDNWIAANNGMGGSPAYIYALTLTPARRLIAATETGLYLLSVGPAPSVTSISPNSGNVAGGTAVTINGSGFQPAASITLGGTAVTNVNVVNATTITATTSPHAAGLVNVVVTNFDNRSGTLPGGFTYSNPVPAVPSGIVATAQTTTSVQISWNPSDQATSYRVFRRDPGAGFTLVGSPTVTSLNDTTAVPNQSYLYRVRAVNGAGESLDSAQDIATTILFSNDPLIAGIVVQAVHLSQIRTATDSVRQLAGIGIAAFTDSASPGVMIRSVHLSEIRLRLDEALSALGVISGGYTDAALTGAVIKAVHFQEIRNRMR